MSDINKKKQRSENWLEEDKQLLQELVKERVKTIENKNTDTNRKKRVGMVCVQLLTRHEEMLMEYLELIPNESDLIREGVPSVSREGVPSTSREGVPSVSRELQFGNPRSTTKKNKKNDQTSTTRDDATNKEILAISSTQVECIKSLNAIQLEVENLKKENEIKKGKVLERKAEVLERKAGAAEWKEKAMQAKFEYYKNKIALLDSRENK